MAVCGWRNFDQPSCNDAIKYEHSVHLPNWKMTSIFWSTPTIPSLQDIPFNNQIKHRPRRIAPQKNPIEQICVVYPRSNRTLSVGIPLCVKFFLWNHFLWLYCHSVGEGNIEITLGDMSRHDMFSSFQILHYARLCSRAQSPLLLLSVYLPYLSIYLPNLIYLIYLKNLI